MPPRNPPLKGSHKLTLKHLASYDDLLTDVLVDKLFYWTNIRKVHPRYQLNRKIKQKTVGDIIRTDVCVGRNIQAATDHLLQIDGVKRFADGLKGPEKGDFIKHLKRYAQLYHPDTPFEVSSTNRYTLSSLEASVVARAKIEKGEVIKNLAGVMVTMTKEEEEEFNEASNRDFSIIHSSRKAGAQIFLGPARFVNHDCNPNCKFSSTSKSTVGFISIREIEPGEELTVFYSDDYFGIKNAECLCQSCEDGMKGGWSKSVGYMDSSASNKRTLTDLEKCDDDYAGRATKRARKSLPTPALSTEDSLSSKASSPVAGNLTPSNPLPTPYATPTIEAEGIEIQNIVPVVITEKTDMEGPKCPAAGVIDHPPTDSILDKASETLLASDMIPKIVAPGLEDGYESDLTVYSDTDMELLNEKYKFGPIIKLPAKMSNPDPASLPQVPKGIRYPGDHLMENTIINSQCQLRCYCQNCSIKFIYSNEDSFRFLNHIPRCCPRCERHSKIYGLVWPKTILKADDQDERIMDPEIVERSVNHATWKRDMKQAQIWQAEQRINEAFKKNLRRENRKLEKIRRKIRRGRKSSPAADN